MKNFHFSILRLAQDGEPVESIFTFQFLAVLLVCLILLYTFYFPSSDFIFADEPGDSNFIYLFHLYYDNGQLFADRDFEFKYDVIPEEFTPETFNTQFPFRGEVISFKNQVASEFLFDPRRGNPDFLKGKISVKAPYFPDGQKVVFYDAQNGSLLTIFVGESSFCNDDEVCNFDRGEDDKTCPNDCRGVLSITPTPSPGEESPTVANPMMWIILTLTLIGTGFGGWYGWKWWQKRKASQPPADDRFTGKLG